MKITAKNFGSTIKEMTIDLSNGVYVLSGVNNDVNFSKSNGSGKSTFINVIAVALLDDTINSSSIKDYIGKYNKNLEVEVTIGDLYVHRVIGKEHYVYILVNGEEPDIMTKQGSGFDVSKANKFILDYFGLTKEQILNYFILSTNERDKSFLAQTPGKKAKILEGLVNTDRISKATQKAKTRLENTTTTLNKTKGSIQAYKDIQNRELSENIPDKRKRIEEAILSLKNNIKDIPENKGNKKQEILDYKAQYESKSQQLQGQIDSILKQIHDLDLASKRIITCPSCSHKFLLNSSMKPGEIPALKSQYQSTLKTTQESLKKYKDGLLRIAKALETIKQNEVNITNIEWENQNIKNSIQQLENELIALNDNKEDYSIKINELDAKITDLTAKQLEIKEHIKEIEVIGHELHNNVVQLIVHNANRILESNRVSMKVQIEGYTKTTKGELRAKLNPLILDTLTGDTKKYVLWSAGERAIIDTAIDIAMQQSLNSNLSLYISDEIASNADSESMKVITSMVSSEVNNGIIVSHTMPDEIFSNTILAVKKDGLTNIEVV